MTETPTLQSGIEADDLHRSFGEVRAVDGVTFTAPSAGVTALIGPNGSGKTPLLPILPGLLKPDSGSARVAGHDVAANNLDARGSVGWMPDAFGTLDTLTCTETLVAFAQTYGLTAAERRQRSVFVAGPKESEDAPGVGQRPAFGLGDRQEGTFRGRLGRRVRAAVGLRDHTRL